jgi:hypothetical protein
MVFFNCFYSISLDVGWAFDRVVFGSRKVARTVHPSSLKHFLRGPKVSRALIQIMAAGKTSTGPRPGPDYSWTGSIAILGSGSSSGLGMYSSTVK